MPRQARVDCGYVDIPQALCAARGCCFSDEANQTARSPPACFFSGAAAPVDKVHVVFANHFDAGYTALTAADDLEALQRISSTVINQYFHEYFPLAAQVGRELRAAAAAAGAAAPRRLSWMTQSWLVSLFLACPPYLGISCPGPAAVSDFETAVRSGDITWHAFPHNAQLPLASKHLVRDLVGQTHHVDEFFGLPPKRTLSQRDVVGLPRAALAALSAQGVDAISVGSNGRCLPPAVANAFVWSDCTHEALVLWHPYGYGGTEGEVDSRPYTQLPGHGDVLFYAWNGDNAGPPNSSQVLDRLAAVRELFPGAEVVVSTLDEFVATIGPDVLAKLPRVTADLEDTWIQGAAQAPDLMRLHRAAQRGFDRCVDTGKCEGPFSAGVQIGDGAAPPEWRNSTRLEMTAQRNFTRLLSKTVEHTFGASLPKFAGEYARDGYSNADFHAARLRKDSTYAFFERSWEENFEFFDAALAALGPGDALRAFVLDELQALGPAAGPPSLDGFDRLEALGDVALGEFTVSVGATGALERCAFRGNEWASPHERLALLKYQTLSDDDFRFFRDQMLRGGADGAGADEYGRPNATAATGALSATVPAAVRAVYRRGDELLVQVGFAARLREDYGAPSDAWLRYAADGETLKIDVLLLNKTSTRFIDSMYLSMHPRLKGDWALDQMGTWTDPALAVDGTSKGIRAVLSGVKFETPAAQRIVFQTPDTPIVNFHTGSGAASDAGEPLPFPLPLSPLDTSRGVSFALYSNGYWNTNYPSFIPYRNGAIHADFAFRFQLDFQS
ncbi:hypothetical protein M885DRAFT_510755 [Pelagophyceae sp. CCMP2097]|nr:hypothetical protein M885DRAFT_510755 [Pelagophyceae sp. CCMP2097]